MIQPHRRFSLSALDVSPAGRNFLRMKFAAILLCSAFALFQTAAQEVITPTNHLELFNGKDFTGWTFCMRSNADPALAWTVTNGVIHCAGKPSGYLRTTQSYSNYALTVEWRFVKVAPKADNTGILVHMQMPDKVWPPCVQVQGKHDNQGDLIYMAGAESREHRGKDANTPVPKNGPANEKPVGEWDTVKTVCDGNDVKAFVNGKRMNEGTECTVTAGAIGFQSEGGEFEIRKVFLEPLK
jgi:hypothetical protein